MSASLRRLVRFYALHLRLLQTWRPGRWALVRHVLLSAVMGYIAFATAAILVRGITATPASILGAVILIGLLNAGIRPVVLALAVPLGLLAVAFLGTALQVVLFLAVGAVVPGLDVVDPTAALEGAVLFAVMNIALSWFIALGDDESYFSHLIRLLIREQAGAPQSEQVGVVIVQIDGLSHPVLVNQIRAGRVPTMSRWVRSGSHRLSPWECQLPSQTSASQAGILLGSNDGIPAFRWYEKSSGRLFVSNRQRDATDVEARLATGHGLLSDGGSSVGNLFAGDAAESILTMSRLSDAAALGPTQSWFYFFASPFALARAIVLTLGEAGKEVWQARRQQAQGIEPRIARGGAYPLLRALTNVLLRQVMVTLMVERILRGVPIMYVTFGDYDEIAHHAGPERSESLDALDGVDGVLGALVRVAEEAPRPYRFIVLSDHGQSQGATFRQRYGMTVEALIRDLLGGRPATKAATSAAEPWGPLNAFLSELVRGAGLGARLLRRLFERRSSDGGVELGPGHKESTAPADRAEPSGTDRPELVVCASGNLALVYLNERSERLTLEDLERKHPGLVEALAHHAGIGFVMVRSREAGPVAIGATGRHYLDARRKVDKRVVGADPLAPFGPHAADDLRRLDAMPNVGDLVLNSRLDPDTQEVAAFEELVGNHGGLGGWQTNAFLLHPSDWPVAVQGPTASVGSDGQLLGAPSVHRQLVAWLEVTGIRSADLPHGSGPQTR